MLDKAKIIARLQSGETMDEIVDDITRTINDVQDEYKAIQKKDEEDARRLAEKKKEADRIHNAKSAAVNDMLDAMCDYLVAAGEEELLNEVKEIDTDRVIELLDGAIEMTKSIENLKALQFPIVDRKWNWIDNILS